MKSSLDSFDYLLNDDILERNWKTLTGGYRNLLVEQQLQSDFVEALESNQQLSVFLENSFTEFSEEMNLTAIERLTGMFESRENQAHSNPLPQRRPQKEDALQAMRNDTKIVAKITKPKLMVKQKTTAPSNTSEPLNSKAKKEAVKPLSKLLQIKTPKKGRNQRAEAITPAIARAELNNRAVSLGRGNEWSYKRLEKSLLEKSHLVKSEMTQNAVEAHNNEVNKADLPLGSNKKERSGDHKQNVKVEKEQAFTSSPKKTIDRLMDEKVKDLQAANKTDSEHINRQRNHTRVASRNKQPPSNASLVNDDPPSTSTSRVAGLVSPGTGVGGLRGLAALAEANTEGDKSSLPATGETNQNLADAKVTQKPSLNVIDNNTSFSQPSSGASFAKLLADEARRAGIDLEKFQP